MEEEKTKEDLYKDPENRDEILDKIKDCETLKDINELIKEVYPTWIVNFIDNYSTDYPHLQANWKYVVREMNIKKGQILLIDDYKSDDDHKLIQIFFDIYTSLGFIVRKKDELIPCNICHRAIPNETLFKKMKDAKLNLKIDTWSSTCSTCNY
jgi:hypothetical protein